VLAAPRLRPQSGVLTLAGAAREVGASVSLARGFLSRKAENFDALARSDAERRPFESQSPHRCREGRVSRPVAPDWRGLVEGPTIGETEIHSR